MYLLRGKKLFKFFLNLLKICDFEEFILGWKLKFVIFTFDFLRSRITYAALVIIIIRFSMLKIIGIINVDKVFDVF